MSTFPSVESAIDGELATRRGMKVEYWILILACALRIGLDISDLELGVSLSLSYCLPAVAAWIAHRHGATVLWPMLLIGLLPRISVSLPFGSVSLGLGLVECLAAVAIGWFAASPAQYAAASSTAWLRAGWRWPALTAVAVWAMSTMVGLPFRAPWAPGSLAALSIPAVVVVLVAVDWRRAAALAHDLLPRHAVSVAQLWACLVALALVASASFSPADPLHVGIGSVAANSIVPMACFIGILLKWVDPKRLLLTLFACALLVEPLLNPLARLPGIRIPFHSQWLVMVPAVCAVLLAQEVAALKVAAGGGWRRVKVALVLTTVWFVWPALNQGSIGPNGPMLWVLAGAAFLAGVEWRGKALFAVPVGILLGYLLSALAWQASPEDRLWNLLIELGTITLPFSLFGVITRRNIDRRSGGAQAFGASLVDVSALAAVVQRLDHSATLRAFGVLFGPMLLVLHLSGAFKLESLAANGDPGIAFGVLLNYALLLLTPLGFVVLDWIKRQPSLRALSAGSAALIGSLGVGAIGAVIGVMPKLVDVNASDKVTALWLLAATAASLAALMVVWLVGVGHRLLLGCSAVASMITIVGCIRVVMALQAEGEALTPVLVTIAVLVLVAVWVVRAVTLRVVLAENRPRDLMLGTVQAGIWVRLAALSGLPAILWRRSAWREPSFYAFALARPLVYLGGAWLNGAVVAAAVVLALGHAAFVGGKCLAARAIWKPGSEADARPPILFLRGFDDDQFTFKRPSWQLPWRWFDFWSFRRNADEVLVDEAAQYGPVVALGRPGETARPFGGMRHYADHKDWQNVVETTAARARTIVLAAGDSEGLHWEIDLLRRRGLLDRTVLLFQPNESASNRDTLTRLLGSEGAASHLEVPAGLRMVALLPRAGLLVARIPTASAYVAALRAHLQGYDASTLRSVLD